MASNQVNINLNLQDQSNSIKNRTDEVKNLNKELQKSQNLATGTKSGSRAAAASLGAGENIEYGRARGSMGSTGASGRDFANQAQGLGGLVRLYATYAANVFAVSAAFSALSNAMDTSNMVKGLDQWRQIRYGGNYSSFLYYRSYKFTNDNGARYTYY